VVHVARHERNNKGQSDDGKDDKNYPFYHQDHATVECVHAVVYALYGFLVVIFEAHAWFYRKNPNSRQQFFEVAPPVTLM
jgi:hypothetical protein